MANSFSAILPDQDTITLASFSSLVHVLFDGCYMGKLMLNVLQSYGPIAISDVIFMFLPDPARSRKFDHVPNIKKECEPICQNEV